MPLAFGVFFREFESQESKTLMTELWPAFPDKGLAV
jgi:hypothetical protein